MPETKVVIGGQVDSSLVSAVDSVKAKVRELVGETVRIATESDAGAKAYEIALDHVKDKVMELTLGPLASFAVGIGAINGAMWLMDKATGAAAQGLEKFSTIEDLEGTFRTLLGGATQARERLGELARFAETTPFQLPEVAAASRTLEVLTRGALSTGEGLRLVGDVAAQTGAPIQEISMWIGRLYDNLQSGRPIGEAMMRLQELGTVSGATRARIEEMQKAGMAGNDVWKVAKGEFDRAAGSMVVLGQTITGLRSTLEDTKGALMRAVGKSFAEQEREAVAGATEALEAMTPVAEHAAEVLADMSIGDVPGQWFPMFDAGLKKIITTALGAKEAINGLIDAAVVAGSAIAATVTATALSTLVGFIRQTGIAIAAVRALTAAVGAESLAWNLSAGAIVANTRRLAAQYILQGRSAAAAYAQAAAVAVLRGAFASATAAARSLTAALLVSPYAWITAAAVGIYLYLQRLERASKASMELAVQSAALTQFARHATDEIKTVSDKIAKLAEAYKLLADARKRQAAAAPGSEEEEHAQDDVRTAKRAVRRIEQVDDRTLKPGADRQKFQDEAAALQMAAYEKSLDPVKALELAQARLNDQLRIQATLEQDAGKAIHAASAEKLTALEAERDRRQAVYDAADAADKQELERLNKAPGKPVKLIAEITARRQQRTETEGKQIEDLSARIQSLPASAETTRTAAAQGRVNVQKARDEVTGATSKKAEYDDKTAEIAAEREIAALEGEGIDRAYREFAIRQALIQQRWEAAKAAGDVAKAEEMNLRYYEGQRKMAKELGTEADADRDRDRTTAEADRSRLENRRKRKRDAALAEGRITPAEFRSKELAALKKQQDQANADAADFERRAKEARAKGDEAGADKFSQSAIEKRKAADTFYYDAAEMERKQPGKPVADSLAKLGLGGNVAPAGLSNLAATNQTIAERVGKTNDLLKQLLDKPHDATARFSR